MNKIRRHGKWLVEITRDSWFLPGMEEILMESKTRLLTKDELDSELGAGYEIFQDGTGCDMVRVPMYGDLLPDVDITFSRRVLLESKLPISLENVQKIRACEQLTVPSGKTGFMMSMDAIAGTYDAGEHTFCFTSSPKHILFIVKNVFVINDAVDAEPTIEDSSFDSEFCVWGNAKASHDEKTFTNLVYTILEKNAIADLVMSQ